MTPLEIRATASLASLFALRMLGLFLVLPVLAIHARHLPGGDNQTLVGIALGIYGLTQGCLQIPFGMAADRHGRKRVIVIGLALFALGSFVAALAQDIAWVIAGRSLQGAGAISAAVVALAADLTRDSQRTKSMAVIGASIGLMFALSLVAAPALYGPIGVPGMFALTGVLALGAIWVTLAVVPPEPPLAAGGADPGAPAGGSGGRRVRGAALAGVLAHPELLRLNLGIFALHAVLMAIFVVVPLTLVESAGMAVGDHWKVYLPAVCLSFVLMIPLILAAERGGRLKPVLLGMIALLGAVLAGLLWCRDSLAMLAVLLLAFFVAFNVMEAVLPSLVTRYVPAFERGTAIGVFNTTQSLGLAGGAAAGGWVAQNLGADAVFVGAIALVALWGLAAAFMRAPAPRNGQGPAAPAAADPAVNNGL